VVRVGTFQQYAHTCWRTVMLQQSLWGKRMDGIHDLGGTQFVGPVEQPGPNEPFHHRWEARIFAIGALSQTRLSGANLDSFRFAIDRTPPAEYLGLPYYNKWLRMAETLLTESGVIAPGAIDARVRKRRGEKVEEPPVPELRKPDYKPTAGGSLRQTDRKPKFSVGQRVHTIDSHTSRHTRLPRYVRRRVGTVTMIQPAHVLPDTHSVFLGENIQHVYKVQFDSAELWGQEAEKFAMNLDLYEDYLEAA